MSGMIWGGKDHQDQGDRGEDVGNDLGSFFNLSGVFRSGSVFGSGSGLVLLFWGVLSFSFVFDISNESTIMVGSVGHSLDATVRKVDPVGTDNGTLLILVLHSLEVGSRVLVSNSIFEGIWLGRMLLSGMLGGSIGGGSRGVLRSGFVGGRRGSISGGTIGIGHGESHGGADKSQECQALHVEV